MACENEYHNNMVAMLKLFSGDSYMAPGGLETILSPVSDIQYCDHRHDLTGPRR
jgi:hypothetical protein